MNSTDIDELLDHPFHNVNILLEMKEISKIFLLIFIMKKSVITRNEREALQSDAILQSTMLLIMSTDLHT